MNARAASASSESADPNGTPGGVLQRKCGCAETGEGCERCGGNPKGDVLRRKAVHAPPGPRGASSVPSIVHEVLRSSGQALDAATRTDMGARFGHDFSGVRVHTDGEAAKSARAVDASAYTVGSHVVFAAGRYAPGSRTGRRLLAHELAHIVQQRGQTAGLQSKLAIGETNDPAEAIADRAADAVMAGRKAPRVAPASPVLRRQPASDAPRQPTRPLDLTVRPSMLFGPPLRAGDTVVRVDAVDADTRMVTLQSGRRVIVIRKHDIERREGTRRAPRVTAEPGINRERIWLEIDWCSGANEGEITLGTGIPPNLLTNVRDAITSGGDLGRALGDTELTPFLETHTRIGRWHINLGGRTGVTLGGESTGAGGSLRVGTDTSRGSVGVTVHAESVRVGNDAYGGVQGGITFDFSPGPPPGPRCERRHVSVVDHVTYECREPDTPAQRIPRTRQLQDEQDGTIYFDASTARVNRALSAQDLTQITQLLRDGYRIASIVGYTSPEGTQPRSPGFEGNERLADERAAAAEKLLRDTCQREQLGDCFLPGVHGRGNRERYTLEDPTTGTEVDTRREPGRSGQARHAIREFGSQEREAGRRSTAVSRRVVQAGRTPRQQAEPVYEQLRRAEIHLVRQRTEPYVEEVPGREGRDLQGGCPDHLIRQAFPEEEGGPTR